MKEEGETALCKAVKEIVDKIYFKAIGVWFRAWIELVWKGNRAASA